MFQQIFSIARNTFIESIRQPIYSVLTLVALLILIMSPAIAAYTMDDDNKILVDMGLSTIFVLGLFLAAFTATGVFTNEIENKTVLTVISKPVSRTIFVLGKYVGVSFAIGMAFTIMSSMLLLTMRHKVMQTASDQFDAPVITFGLLAGFVSVGIATLGNYFYRWVFTSTLMRCLSVSFFIAVVLVMFIGKGTQPGSFGTFQHPATDFVREGAFEYGQIFVGLLLLFFALLLIIAVALAASTRLKQAMTLIICLGVFCMGLTDDFFFGNQRHGQGAMEYIYGVIPNIQFLWPADFVTQGYVYSTNYIALTALYTLGFIVALLSLAIGLFQTREVG